VKLKIDPKAVRKHAMRFSKIAFQKGFLEILEREYGILKAK
jgi:hypothetical protein